MDSDDAHLEQATLRIGTLLCGKYTVDRILGVGGMAVVYAATHRNQKQVAIKMLHPELSVHAEVKKRFLREGYVANSVKHKGAVDVIDDDVAEDGSAFIVMEYLEGQPVDAIANARGGRVPVGAAIAVVYDLCGVLAAAHDRGIVHRDIKPANLFVTMDGELKVLDFGIARLRDSSSGQATNTGMMLGTPAFMAPEQARGETPAIGPGTDIWSAGATLFNLLTGANVYDADNAQMYMIKVATAPPRSIATVMPDLPRDVISVVDKALAFTATDRWTSAASMRAALREAYVTSFGEFSPARTLAPLVGGKTGGSVPAPSQTTKGGLGAAATVIDPAPRSQAGAGAQSRAPGGTTAFPVTASFVKPITSKRTITISAAVVALVVGSGLTAVALRGGTEKSSSAAAIVEMPASAPPASTAAPSKPDVPAAATTARAAATPEPNVSGSGSATAAAVLTRSVSPAAKPPARMPAVTSQSPPATVSAAPASAPSRSPQPAPVDPGSIR